MTDVKENSADLIEKTTKALSDILTREEKILAVAEQTAINSPLKKDYAVITNRRFIAYRSKLFGRMDMRDYQWQDVEDVHLSQKILGSMITLSTRTSEYGAVISGLDKKQARQVYSKAQELEEQWREKNRIRDMEEERARSGGVFIASQPGTASAPASNLQNSSGVAVQPEERLAKLKELYDNELLSDAEYEAKKTQIMAEF